MKQSLGAKTLVYPTPVLVVGTYGEDGRPNMACVAWGGICCSQPPCLSISLREATLTHGNLHRARAFTVNIPSASQIKAADYAGIYSGRDEDKFESLGLTPTRAEKVDAPLVEEFPLNLECELLHVVELGLHTQFIGEIKDVKADVSILDPDGGIDVGRLDCLFFGPLERCYYRVGEFAGKAFSVGRKD